MDISELRVVVRAHVVQEYETSQIRYRVERAVVHEDYWRKEKTHDIMLLQLVGSIEFSETVRPICVDKWTLSNGTSCMVTGWGSTSPSGNRTHVGLQRRRWSKAGGAGSCTFPTDEIMGAQNFDFVPTFFKMGGGSATNFALLNKNYTARKKFPTIFQQPKI